MNKAELIRKIADRTGMTQKTSEVAVNALIGVISKTLADGQPIRIMGFGTFRVKNRAARMGYNPKTEEAIDIEASKIAVFKPSALLKSVISGK